MARTWEFYPLLCAIRTAHNEAFRSNLGRDCAPKATTTGCVPESPWRQRRLRPAFPLTLFCFRALFSFMWGQSFPVTMALMSATGTVKQRGLVSGSFLLQDGSWFGSRREAPTPRLKGLYLLRECGLLLFPALWSLPMGCGLLGCVQSDWRSVQGFWTVSPRRGASNTRLAFTLQ